MSQHHGLDRRAFVVSAGACVIAASLPALTIAAVGDAAVTGAAAERLADWSIDDMWGVYPRPAQAIGFGRPRTSAPLVAEVDTQFG
jgi:hypothetical protein